MKPLISVIIPAFNCVKYIRQTLDSALSQDYENFEIICVDDGSTDNTLNILREYSRKFPDKVNVLTQKNSGPAAARNLGIKKSRGEFVAFLDSDDIWLAEKLSLQSEVLLRDKNIAFVHADFAYFNDEEEEKKSEFCIAEKKKFSGDIFHALFKKNFILTSSVLARKEILEKTGLMDEGFRMSEDYELWLRIAQGSKAGYVDKALVKYRKHSQSMTTDNIERTYSWVEKATEKIIKSFPEKRAELLKIAKFRYAKNYFTIGYHYMIKDQFLKARKNFEASLKNKFSFSVLKYYLMTFFPFKVIKNLRRLINKA
ncbi:MAG: glycosyltransferase [Candidatus Omnitrophica bacterium]|nr:glycosyltransferase [Candidatus Omnitrophota bacterium]